MLLQVILTFLLSALPRIAFATGQVKQAFVVSLDNNIKWFPNTELIDGQPAFHQDLRHWFFISKGGLIRYDKETKHTEIFRINDLSLTNEAWLTGFAKVDKKLWVSTWNIVYVFDMEKMQFTDSFSVMKNNNVRESLNLTLVYDFTSDNIWASTFMHLYLYDAKQWINLDNIFKDFDIGEPSSQHIIFIDEDFVWVAAPPHTHSKGALLQYNKKTKEWRAFKKEDIEGLDFYGIEVDITDIISSQKYVWIGPFYYKNRFVFPVYDKKINSWKIYEENNYNEAIELLISELPSIRWLGKINVTENKSIEQHEKLKNMIEKLGISNDINWGMYKDMIQDSKILSRTEPYGVYHVVSEIAFPQVSYKKIIRSIDDETVLVETNEGLALLDTNIFQIKRIAPQIILQGKVGSFFDKTKKRVLICEERLDFSDKIISIDIANLEGKELIDLPLSFCKESDPIPTSVFLGNGKRVNLRWDGLVVEP